MEEKKVKGITGDYDFMANFQSIARQVTKILIFMSSLCQLPAVTCGYAQKEQMIIMTANGKSLGPMRNLTRDECGIDKISVITLLDVKMSLILVKQLLMEIK